MPEILPAPQYRCHKVVKAAQITKIIASDIGLRPVLALTGEEDGSPCEFGWAPDGDFMERHKPEVGGYLVFYEDGYISFSPAAAFEAGYTRLTLPCPTQGAVGVAGEVAQSDCQHPRSAAAERWPDMPRTLTDHQTNECNQRITIEADKRDPTNGNASHTYLVRWYEQDESGMEVNIPFQHGPIKEAGVNGLTNEVLLAIVIDRMRGFQSGKYACRENAIMLTKLEEALHWSHARTRSRVVRGVEGTHEL